MRRSLSPKLLFIGIAISFLIFSSPSFLKSENIAKGKIIGYVYDTDGTTPLKDAVVRIKHVSTGAVFESNKSDSLGVFKIEGVEEGIYIFSVTTAQGGFNSNGPLGVRFHENKTAEMAISLTPYIEKIRSVIKEVHEEQKTTGEALVGRVINYNPDTRMAEIFITKGLLQLFDRIHAIGENTDFYQDVNFFKLEGSSAKIGLADQIASIGVKRKVEANDLICVVRKKGIFSFLLNPLGVASIIAGTSAIVYSPADLDEILRPSSPSRLIDQRWERWLGRNRWPWLDYIHEIHDILLPKERKGGK